MTLTPRIRMVIPLLGVLQLDPTNGAASIDSGTGVLSYTPTAHYNGSDSLVVQVSDGSLSDRVTVNLSISAVNDAPVVTDLNATLALTLPEGSSLVLRL